MSTLFKDSDVFVKQRPTDITSQQKKEFYHKMAQEIIDCKWSNSHISVIAEDLRLLSLRDNGYEMAKELDDYRASGNYSIDTSFCEWLDGLRSEYDDILEHNIRQWVKAHNIKPKWLVGFCLKVTSSKFLSFKQGEYIYINYVYKDTAKYTVNKSGLKGGYLIDFEKVEDNCILMTNG